MEKKSSLATKYWHKIQELEKERGALLRENKHLKKIVKEKDEVVKRREERIEELEAEVRQLKGTGKKLKGIIFKEKSKQEEKNKRGARKGHRGNVRKRPTVEAVSNQKEVFLSQCPCCDEKISEKDRKGWTNRMGIDIPFPVTPLVTLYHIARYHCRSCKKWVQGTPAGLFGKSPFGINIMMLVLHLKYKGKATDNHIRESLELWYGVYLSDGGVQNTLERAALLFGSSYEGIKQAIREGKYVYADETGWRVEGENWYTWAFTNEKSVLYSIENTRGGGIPEEILEGFTGVLMSDGYQAYNSVEGAEQALCGVHFLRHTKHAAEMEPVKQEAKTFHEQMVWFYRVARKRHKKCKTEEDRLNLYAQMKRALERFWKNITYEDSEVEKIRKWWLERRHEQLLVFLKYDYLDWHNNNAERVIRPFVTRRKMSGGSRSKRGSEREAINMSIIYTLLKQKKDILQEIPLLLEQGFKEIQRQKFAEQV